MQCKAQAKQTGNQCRRYAMIGKEVCMMHGGKSRGGVASPRFKNGRYSRYLPHGLLERYSEIVIDPRLLEMREEIAFQRVLIYQAVDELDGIEEAAAAGELSGEAVWQKRRRGWRRLTKMLLERSQLVLREVTRQAKERETLTVEQALAFTTAIADSLSSHISDQDVLTAVVADINRITSG